MDIQIILLSHIICRLMCTLFACSQGNFTTLTILACYLSQTQSPNKQSVKKAVMYVQSAYRTLTNYHVIIMAIVDIDY